MDVNRPAFARRVGRPDEHVAAPRGSGLGSISSSGDGLFIDAGAQQWEHSAAGDVVHEWSGLATEGGRSIQTTPGGHVLRTTYAPSGTTTTDLETGATIATPPSQQVLTDPDDGSAPMLLLTAGTALTAWDLPTGVSRWTTNGAVSTVVVLDGTVYSVGNGTLRAQDAQTGAVRWTAPVGAAASASLETDGRSLLVLGAAAGSDESLLHAVDLQDGSELLDEPPGSTTRPNARPGTPPVLDRRRPAHGGARLTGPGRARAPLRCGADPP